MRTWQQYISTKTNEGFFGRMLTKPEAPAESPAAPTSPTPPPHAPLTVQHQPVPQQQARQGSDAIWKAIDEYDAARKGGHTELAMMQHWMGLVPGTGMSDYELDYHQKTVLKYLKKYFGFDPFYPTNYSQYPSGWVKPAPGTRMTTGDVTRVLRPGLTSGGQLRAPALIEAR